MFAIETHNDVSVIMLNQSVVTMYENEQFKKDFDDILSKGPKKMLLDLSRAEFISSVVLASLIYVLKRTKQQGILFKICGLRPKVQEVFDITNLDKIFEIYASREDAFKSFA